ncbi:MAG TPA: signal peptidase II [Chitinophagaceae bacterium]
MNSKLLLRTLVICFLIVVNIGCDQVSKIIIREKVQPYEMVSLLSNHLTVTRVENSGAFLSAGDSLPAAARQILLVILPVLAMIGGLAYLFLRRGISRLAITGLCCILGGGAGNLFDRFTYGSVTDFLHLRFGVFQTGIFNLADVSVMTGLGLLLVHGIMQSGQKLAPSLLS